MDTMPPNMPMPTMNDWLDPTENTPFLNSRSGSSASSPILRSTMTNATRPMAPST